MKKISALMLAFIAITVATTGFLGCKKGEEDPGISLKSRKGRVTGEWTLTAMEMTGTNNSTNSDPNPTSPGNVLTTEENYTMSFDGTSIAETNTRKEIEENGDYQMMETSSTGSAISTKYSENNLGTLSSTTEAGTYAHTYSATYTFEKDGKFKMTSTRMRRVVTTETDPEFSRTSTELEEETETIDGTWSFVGKDKTSEFKNKERIAIFYTSNSYTHMSSDADVYVDNDATDFITWTDFNQTDASDTEGTDTNIGTVPDEVWEIIQLKGKEMKVIAAGKQTGSGSSALSHTEVSNGVNVTTTGTSTLETEDIWTMAATLTSK